MRITQAQLRQIIREELVREAMSGDPAAPEFDALELEYIAAGLIDPEDLRQARARKAAGAASRSARREERRAAASSPSPRDSEADYDYDLELAARARARHEAGRD